MRYGLPGADGHIHGLVEESSGFRRGKTQVCAAQLEQLTPAAQPRQGQLWILTGGNNQPHLWWQVLEHKSEGAINRFGIDNVVVIDDQDEIIHCRRDFIEQEGEK
jgi:hypothetical protein